MYWIARARPDRSAFHSPDDRDDPSLLACEQLWYPPATIRRQMPLGYLRSFGAGLPIVGTTTTEDYQRLVYFSCILYDGHLQRDNYQGILIRLGSRAKIARHREQPLSKGWGLLYLSVLVPTYLRGLEHGGIGNWVFWRCCSTKMVRVHGENG